MSAVLMTQSSSSNTPEVYNPRNNTGLFNGLIAWNRRQDDELNRKRDKIEYLFDDEYKSIGPTWGARVCYGVGTTYIMGLGLGGVWASMEALFSGRSLALPTTRLRLNHLLNTVSSRGPFLANNGACLALLYNVVHGAIIHNQPNGEHGLLTATVSAAVSGALFRMSRGPRAMGQGAAVLGSAMLLYASVRDYIRHGKIYIY